MVLDIQCNDVRLILVAIEEIDRHPFRSAKPHGLEHFIPAHTSILSPLSQVEAGVTFGRRPTAAIRAIATHPRQFASTATLLIKSIY